MDHVLGLLLEKEQFTRKYTELVNSTKSQISNKMVEIYDYELLA